MFTQHRLTISIISYFVIGFIGQMLILVGTIVFAIKVYPFLDNIGKMCIRDRVHCAASRTDTNSCQAWS